MPDGTPAAQCQSAHRRRLPDAGLGFHEMPQSHRRRLLAPPMARRLAFLLIALGIALAACSPATPEATTSTTDRPGAADGDGPAAWANPDLPLPVTQLATAGDVIMYETVVAGQPFLIGVDATTGTELYRLDAYPLTRLRAVTWTVLVDEDRGQVVRRFFDTIDGDDVARLAAHDVQTGAELWRASAPWDAEQPNRCGHAYCLRADDTQFAFDAFSGALEEETPIPDRRILGSEPDTGFILTVDFAEDGTTIDDLVGTKPSGETWRISGDALRALGGSDVSPRNGWSDTVDDTGTLATLYLGTPAAPSGVMFGYDLRAGELLWARPSVTPCTFAATDAPIACSVDPSGATTTIALLDHATGLDVWSFDLPTATAAPTVFVAPGVVALTTAGDRFLLDLATGDRLPTPAATLCAVGGGFVDVDYPEFGSVAYRAEELVTFCGASGELLHPAAVITTEPDLAEQFLVATSSMWVGIGPDGGLVGIPIG